MAAHGSTLLWPVVTAIIGAVLFPTLPRVLCCDSLVALPSATSKGHAAIYAKNADRGFDEAQPLFVESGASHAPGAVIELPSGLTVPQVNYTYATAGSRPFWGWGYSMGANEFGVAIGNEFFPCKTLPVNDSALLEFPDIDRLVLQRSRTAAEAVQWLTHLVSTYGQGVCKTCPSPADYNNLFLLVDKTEAYKFMTIGHEWAYSRITTSTDSISNWLFEGAEHVSPTAQATAKQHGWWDGKGDFDFGKVFGVQEGSGVVRQKRTSTFLLNKLKTNTAVRVEDMANILGDHYDGANPSAPVDKQPHWTGTEIDEHTDGRGLTASSLITDFVSNGTRVGIAWHALTNVCMSLYYPVFFLGNGTVGKVPAWLTTTEPWQQFKYITYSLARHDQEKIATVQATWQPVQTALFASAREVATQASSLIAEGDRDQAALLVGKFTASVVDTMQQTLLHLNNTLA